MRELSIAGHQIVDDVAALEERRLVAHRLIAACAVGVKEILALERWPVDLVDHTCVKVQFWGIETFVCCGCMSSDGLNEVGNAAVNTFWCSNCRTHVGG